MFPGAPSTDCLPKGKYRSGAAKHLVVCTSMGKFARRIHKGLQEPHFTENPKKLQKTARFLGISKEYLRKTWDTSTMKKFRNSTPH